MAVVAFLLVPVKILLCVAIRYGTTLIYIWPGLRNIPENWSQCAFKSSIFDEVWIIPGHYNTSRLFLESGLTGRFGEPTVLQAAQNMAGLVVCLVVWAIAARIPFLDNQFVNVSLALAFLLSVPFFIVGLLAFSVALFPRLLRATLKASSIVWSPLIYSVNAPLEIGANRDEIIKHYELSFLSRIALKYAYVVILLAACATLWSFVKFLGYESLDPSTKTAIHILSLLSFLNALIAVFVWEAVLPRIKHASQERWWRVLLWSKFTQGAISIVTIPTMLITLSPWLPDIYRFLRSVVIVTR